MPAGDNSRVWFAELVETLKQEWKPDYSFERFIQLCDKLNLILSSIQKERNIKPPRMYCDKCKRYDHAAPSRATVGSIIFALKRFNIADENYVNNSYKKWKTYKKKNKLDACGKPVEKVISQDH